MRSLPSVPRSWTRRFGTRFVALMVVAGAAAASLTGCSPAVVINSLVPDEGYRVQTNVAYGPESRQLLDVYVPSAGGDAPRPIVVYFYGGSWKSGTRDYYKFIGEAFARRGYLVVVPDYRLYPEVRFPAFVDDGALAIRWVRDNAAAFGGDGERIILMGHSAGAHIAALLTLDGRYLAAAGVPRSAVRGTVGLAGPYAIDPLEYETTRPIFAGIESADAARPVAFVDGDEPPMLLLHGAADRTVRPVNSRMLADAIEGAGGKARYVMYPELGHIGIVVSLSAPFRGRDAVYEDVNQFLASL